MQGFCGLFSSPPNSLLVPVRRQPKLTKKNCTQTIKTKSVSPTQIKVHSTKHNKFNSIKNQKSESDENQLPLFEAKL